MRVDLIPVGSGTVVGNILVSVTVFNGDFDVFLERNWIRDIQTICGNLPKRIIFVDQPAVWSGKFTFVEIPSG